MIIKSAGFPVNHINDFYRSHNATKSGSFLNNANNKISFRSQTDKIEISQNAKAAGSSCSALKEIKTQIKRDMDRGTDQAKLDNIKSQIKNGSYKVDADEIAGSILYDT